MHAACQQDGGMGNLCATLCCCTIDSFNPLEKWDSPGTEPALCTATSFPKSYRLRPVLDNKGEGGQRKYEMEDSQAMCIPGLMKLPSVLHLCSGTFHTVSGRDGCNQPSALRDKELVLFPIRYPALCQK